MFKVDILRINCRLLPFTSTSSFLDFLGSLLSYDKHEYRNFMSCKSGKQVAIIGGISNNYGSEHGPPLLPAARSARAVCSTSFGDPAPHDDRRFHPDSAPTPPLPGAGCKLAPPAPYTGAPGLYKTFIINCSIHFELMPHAFSTDQSKVAFMISHLTDRAKAWASAEWGWGALLCDSLTDFQAALTKTFDLVSSSREKAQELSSKARQQLRV